MGRSKIEKQVDEMTLAMIAGVKEFCKLYVGVAKEIDFVCKNIRILNKLPGANNEQVLYNRLVDSYNMFAGTGGFCGSFKGSYARGKGGRTGYQKRLWNVAKRSIDKLYGKGNLNLGGLTKTEAINGVRLFVDELLK